MHMKEIIEKNTTELAELLTQKKEELRKIRFGTAGSGMRDTRVVRNLRREIAQIMTRFAQLEKSGDTTNGQ